MHTMSRYTILFICPLRIFVMRLRKRVAAVRSWIAIKTISLAILPAVANAQAAEPVQDEVCADDIIVTGTVVDVRLRQGASEISAGRVVELSSDSIADALAFEPSVNATPRYGVVDQLFLTIRGSGRQRRPSARGLSILIDDVPINRGDRKSTRSEEHTSELQSLMRISYAVFCLKKKKIKHSTNT